MAIEGKVLGGAATVLEMTAEEFVLGSKTTERNNSRENMTERPLLPYIVLVSGILFLGAGLWISASIAFTAYVVVTASSFEKNVNQDTLLPSELTSTSLDEKSVHDFHFFTAG